MPTHFAEILNHDDAVNSSFQDLERETIAFVALTPIV